MRDHSPPSRIVNYSPLLGWPRSRRAFRRQSRAVEIRTIARPVQRLTVRVERRPVHRLVAGAARPGGVAAAVTEASLIAHERPAGAELVAVGASRRRMDDPLPGRGLYKLAQHRLGSFM